jgi:hypothetical protein
MSWDGDETSTPTGGDDHPMEVREPTPLPQADVVAEATLKKATLVEGLCTGQLADTKHSSHSRGN